MFELWTWKGNSSMPPMWKGNYESEEREVWKEQIEVITELENHFCGSDSCSGEGNPLLKKAFITNFPFEYQQVWVTVLLLRVLACMDWIDKIARFIIYLDLQKDRIILKRMMTPKQIISHAYY